MEEGKDEEEEEEEIAERERKKKEEEEEGGVSGEIYKAKIDKKCKDTLITKKGPMIITSWGEREPTGM